MLKDRQLQYLCMLYVYPFWHKMNTEKRMIINMGQKRVYASANNSNSIQLATDNYEFKGKRSGKQ